jgi:hypothetical protein
LLPIHPSCQWCFRRENQIMSLFLPKTPSGFLMHLQSNQTVSSGSKTPIRSNS